MMRGMDTTQRAGQLIRDLRERHYDSVTHACNTAGNISRPTWEKIERGGQAQDAKLARIDRAFGWPPSTTKKLRTGQLDEPPPVTVPTDVAGSLRSIAVQIESLAARFARLEERVDRIESEDQ